MPALAQRRNLSARRAELLRLLAEHFLERVSPVGRRVDRKVYVAVTAWAALGLRVSVAAPEEVASTTVRTRRTRPGGRIHACAVCERKRAAHTSCGSHSHSHGPSPSSLPRASSLDPTETVFRGAHASSSACSDWIPDSRLYEHPIAHARRRATGRAPRPPAPLRQGAWPGRTAGATGSRRSEAVRPATRRSTRAQSGAAVARSARGGCYRAAAVSALVGRKNGRFYRCHRSSHRSALEISSMGMPSVRSDSLTAPASATTTTVCSAGCSRRAAASNTSLPVSLCSASRS